MPTRSVLRLLLAALALLLLPAIAARAAYTPEEWAILKTGEVVVTEAFSRRPDGTPATDVLVKAWIKAPREEVWKTLRDYDRFAQFFPRVRECGAVRREGEIYHVRYRTEILWVTVIYYLRLTGTEPFRRIDFVLDPDYESDVKAVRGYWQFDDAPGGQGTVLSYSIAIESSIPAPEALARRISTASLVQVVKNARLRVESGNTWQKPPGS